MKPNTVIISVGSDPKIELLPGITEEFGQVLVIGDAKSPGNLGASLRSATEIALQL